MIVYRVSCDLSFQGLLSEDFDKILALTRDPSEPLGDVTFPTCYVASPKDKRGNFFSIGSSTLVCDDTARRVLEPVMPSDSEYYPVEVEGIGGLTYMSVLVRVDVLNANETQWRRERDGTRRIILDYEFFAEKLVTVPSLFRIPEHRYTKLFTVTGKSSQKDDFYTRYHDAGLTGLKFQKLWSDDT